MLACVKCVSYCAHASSLCVCPVCVLLCQLVLSWCHRMSVLLGSVIQRDEVSKNNVLMSASVMILPYKCVESVCCV